MWFLDSWEQTTKIHAGLIWSFQQGSDFSLDFAREKQLHLNLCDRACGFVRICVCTCLCSLAVWVSHLKWNSPSIQSLKPSDTCTSSHTPLWEWCSLETISSTQMKRGRCDRVIPGKGLACYFIWAVTYNDPDIEIFTDFMFYMCVFQLRSWRGNRKKCSCWREVSVWLRSSSQSVWRRWCGQRKPREDSKWSSRK